MALDLWNKLKDPPKEALKLIEAGRLKGKSDINPTWRYQALTEEFGPCGIGWKYVITRQWTEPGLDGQLLCFVNVDLYIKPSGTGSQWSDPIPGIGGDFLIKKEKEGLHHNDEAYAMALTDALGKSMKVLGMAASVYWNKAPETKNSRAPQPASTNPGDYPINFKNYQGPLKDADRKTIEWIANEYTGRDAGAKQAAKAYLNYLYDLELEDATKDIGKTA